MLSSSQGGRRRLGQGRLGSGRLTGRLTGRASGGSDREAWLGMPGPVAWRLYRARVAVAWVSRRRTDPSMTCLAVLNKVFELEIMPKNAHFSKI